MRPGHVALALGLAAAAVLPARADVLDLLRRAGAEITVLGAAAGLDGYHVTPAGDEEGYALWVTASGPAVVGLLYDEEGRLVTADRLAEAGPAAPPPDRELQPPQTSHVQQPGLPAQRGAAPGAFVIGAAGPVVTVFADPACRWSRATVARLAQPALAGRLTLEVVPVALLGEASARMALAASRPDGAEAWFVRRQAEPDDANTARVRANNHDFAQAGGTAVPLLQWRDADGVTHRRTGAVDDVESFLAELGA